MAAVSNLAFTVHPVLLVRMPNSFSVYEHSGSRFSIFCAPGDLGSIDANYDIAVSSCTGMLDHIVVDSMTTAQVSKRSVIPGTRALLCTSPMHRSQRRLLCAASASMGITFSARCRKSVHAGLRELHPAEGPGHRDLRHPEAAAGAVGPQDGGDCDASGWVLQFVTCTLCCIWA
jgi:hypothetical protein